MKGREKGVEGRVVAAFGWVNRSIPKGEKENSFQIGRSIKRRLTGVRVETQSKVPPDLPKQMVMHGQTDRRHQVKTNKLKKCGGQTERERENRITQ